MAAKPERGVDKGIIIIIIIPMVMVRARPRIITKVTITITIARIVICMKSKSFRKAFSHNSPVNKYVCSCNYTYNFCPL